jgi:hypothetical protein
MNSRFTGFWVALALGLFVFIVLVERHWKAPEAGPPPVLPGLERAAVTSLRVRPAGQLEIRAERVEESSTSSLNASLAASNTHWRLTRPMSVPAEAALIEGFLAHLAQLRAQTHIPAAELRERPDADEAFGFDPPQYSLLLQQAEQRRQLLVGGRTSPGDQVFLQVVGAEGVHVVNADFLQWLPRTPNDWRDRAFWVWPEPAFDRMVVTNAGAMFAVQRESADDSSPNLRWRLAHPLQARADGVRIENGLRALRELRVAGFVTEDPQADAEGYGLRPPDFSLTFVRGTNTVLEFQFGRSPTNDSRLVFARQRGLPSVVLVPREPLAVWRAKYDEFRDRHLLTLSRPVDRIEARGDDAFTLQRQPDDSWRVLPLDLPADAEQVAELVAALQEMRVRRFVKEVVTPPDLPEFGLAAPALRFVLGGVTPRPGDTNGVLGELMFGATQGEETFARRPDESAVYAVAAAEVQRLPVAGFQLRERRLWNFREDGVTGVRAQQGDRHRKLLRQGTNSWSLAPGSEGVINVFAVEETVLRLGQLRAVAWTAVGEEHLARFGFEPDSLQVTAELKSGDQLSVRFGGAAPSGLIYAATTLEGRVWIFESPPAVSQLALTYLTLPVSSR